MLKHDNYDYIFYENSIETIQKEMSVGVYVSMDT